MIRILTLKSKLIQKFEFLIGGIETGLHLRLTLKGKRLKFSYSKSFFFI